MLNLSLGTEYASRVAINVAFYAGLFLSVSCSGHELEHNSNARVISSNAQVISTPHVKEYSPDPAAKKLTELYNNKNCKEFFNAFPSTFKEFDRLYGFDDEKGAQVLFSTLDEHLPYFFGCAEVPVHERLNKVVRIGIGGQYREADSIGVFQALTYDLIIGHPKEAKEILDNLPERKAASFWYFLFDSPHPEDKGNVKRVNLLTSLLGNKSKQSKLLLGQHRKLLTDWKDH